MGLEQGRFSQKLTSGELVVCICLAHARTPTIPMALAACDVDAIYVDLQHTPTSLETAASLCVAALGVGLIPLVRVPSHDPHTIGRALDGGAMGVIVPHVDRVEQAIAVVEAARLPPVGARTAYLASPVLGFRDLPSTEARAALDRETVVATMIESREGVDNAAKIAAVDGVDMLLVGTFDLTRDLGCTSVHDQPVREALVAVADACRSTSTAFGVLGLRDIEVLGDLMARGLQFIGAGNDLGLLQEATVANVTRLRRLKGQDKS